MAHMVQSKAVPDSRTRDIRRRVEVIQKKLADLQELGIPCAFCYSSVRNTGSLFTLGDKRITDVIERHKHKILKNLIDESFSDVGGGAKEIHLILPPLPGKLDQLSRSAMQSLIVGILKDLGVRWSDPMPVWWPEAIPFVHPRSAPENFAGSWTSALKNIIESVYSYFRYDVQSYTATNLDTLNRDESSSSSSEVTTDGNEAGKHDEYEAGNKSGNVPLAAADLKKPNKLVSSFSVENILMGRHNSSSSSSTNNLDSPLGSEHSSVGASWTCHPPVKYTKFTMLSPSSIASGDKRVKPCSFEGTQRDSPEHASDKLPTQPLSVVKSPAVLRLQSHTDDPAVVTTTQNCVISSGVSLQTQLAPIVTAKFVNPFPPQQFLLLMPSTTANDQSTSAAESDSSRPHFVSALPTETLNAELLSRKISSECISKNKTLHKSSQLTTHKRPQKLRFHMTTVVKRARKNIKNSRLTVSSPAIFSGNDALEETGGKAVTKVIESTITKSPNSYSSEGLTKQVIDCMSKPPTAKSVLPDQHVTTAPMTTVKDSGFHLQLVKQTLTHGDISKKQIGSRNKSNIPRTYNRRKRELRFHRYEDPSTAFKSKRPCKEPHSKS